MSTRGNAPWWTISLLVAALAAAGEARGQEGTPPGTGTGQTGASPADTSAPSSADPHSLMAADELGMENDSDVESYVALREALILALRNNVDIELARVEPLVAQQQALAARGAYDPELRADYGFTHSEVPNSTSLEPGRSVVPEDEWQYGTGLEGRLPFGLTYSSGLDMTRTQSTSTIARFEREFLSAWQTEITLPLMRDFGMNQAHAQVVRTELGEQISIHAFTGRLMEIIASVEDLYWGLAGARAQANVAAKSLRTAQDLLEQTRVQHDVGVVSRVAVTQAEAGVAERELNAIRAQNSKEEARDALLNALLAPDEFVYAERDLIPEVPTFTEVKVEFEEALRTARLRRPELAEARTRLEQARVARDLAENEARPRLDLVTGYTVMGNAGRFNSTPSPPTTESWDTFDHFLRERGNHGFAAGAEFSMPLGNRTARATAAQRAIELRRSRTELRRAEQTVILEVRGAVRDMENAAKAVRAAERRRAAAGETLRAEQERLRLGDSTPFQVLEFEEDVAEAERQLIDALRSHRNALTRVGLVQGTLLEQRGIRIRDEIERIPASR